MYTFKQLFLTGSEATLQTVLANKEQRVNKINDYLSKHNNTTIISLKCNIPGPIKSNDAIKSLFSLGEIALENSLQEHDVTAFETSQFDLITGPEKFYYLHDTKSIDAKKIAVLFESTPLGRIFDADVYYFQDNAVQSISRTVLGFAERTCFICDRPAKNCAGRRVHQLAELQEKIVEILNVEGNERE